MRRNRRIFRQRLSMTLLHTVRSCHKLGTSKNSPKSIVNLKNLHKCLIYADFTLLGYRHAGEAVCLPYPLRPRRELLALSFGFLSAALHLIRGELRTLPLPPLAATCRCSHLQQRGSPFSASQSRVLALRIVNC